MVELKYRLLLADPMMRLYFPRTGCCTRPSYYRGHCWCIPIIQSSLARSRLGCGALARESATVQPTVSSGPIAAY